MSKMDGYISLLSIYYFVTNYLIYFFKKIYKMCTLFCVLRAIYEIIKKSLLSNNKNISKDIQNYKIFNIFGNQ